MLFKSWWDAARYCRDTFEAYVDWELRFFRCPKCGESIYEVDWEDSADWDGCPVCGVAWEEI